MLKRQKTNPTHFPVDDTAEASLVKPTSMIRQNQSDRSAAGSTIANYRDDVPPDRDCLTRQTVGSSLGAALSLSDDTIINGHLCSHNNSIQRSVHRLNSKQPLYCSAAPFKQYMFFISQRTHKSVQLLSHRDQDKRHPAAMGDQR